MGLIKNKLNKLKRNKLFWERFGKKATTITVTTSIAFSALFGLVGCNHNKTPEIDIETPETDVETPEIEDETKPPIVDEIENITNEQAKEKVKTAIANAFANNYLHVNADGDIEGECAPNGDMVASRGKYNDYGYYNSADNILIVSNDGEESFVLISDESNMYSTDMKSRFISFIEDELLVLDKAKSANNKYVFVDELGETITVSFENGELKDVICTNEMELLKSSKENYDKLLAEAKEHLKTIGVLDSYKKEVAESLNYKYKSVTASSDITNEIISGVFSGKFSAIQDDMNEKVVYALQTNEEQYGCEINKEGNLIEGCVWENSNPYDLTESFKKDVLMPRNNEKTYTIKYNAQTNTYILTSISGHENGINITTQVKFNDDLSVDVKQTWDHNREDVETEVITYKIEKISKEKFNEMYNKIAAIVENAKQQEDGLTQ